MLFELIVGICITLLGFSMFFIARSIRKGNTG